MSDPIKFESKENAESVAYHLNKKEDEIDALRLGAQGLTNDLLSAKVDNDALRKRVEELAEELDAASIVNGNHLEKLRVAKEALRKIANDGCYYCDALSTEEHTCGDQRAREALEEIEK